MKLHCYHIPPIDFWFGALSEDELFASSWEHCDRNEGNFSKDWGDLADTCRRIADLKTASELAFKTIGWEGDITVGPFFFAVPDAPSMALGYMVKQSNNGNCFIASPEPLPHLDSLAFDKTVAG